MIKKVKTLIINIWQHKWGHRLAVVSLAYVFFFIYFHDYRYSEDICEASNDSRNKNQDFYLVTSTFGAMSASYTLSYGGARINERPYLFPRFAKPEHIKNISFNYNDYLEMGLLKMYIEYPSGNKINVTPGWISKSCWNKLKTIQELELPAVKIIEFGLSE